jgi:uncharacterized protein (TIGR03435 family)
MHRFGDASGNRIRIFQYSAASMIFALVCTCCLLGGTPKLDQPQSKMDAAAEANSPIYEVVSIKPAAPDSDPDSGGTEELVDGYKATNVTLLTLIRRAFAIDLINQVSGGPTWLRSTAFDIQAKLDGSAADRLKKLKPSERKLERQQMLQALLSDRFKLIVHRESRELPVYMLVVAKNGPKLRESRLGETLPTETYDSSLQLGRDGGKLIGPRLTTRQLASMLTSAVGRTVLDKTGLEGAFNVTLQWTADQFEIPVFKAPDNGQRGNENISATNGSWPSIFAAIQEQLGLKLEAGKGPVEIIVIDHVEKPSGN